MWMIFYEEEFERKLREMEAYYRKVYEGLLVYDVEEEISRFKV